MLDSSHYCLMFPVVWDSRNTEGKEERASVHYQSYQRWITPHSASQGYLVKESFFSFFPKIMSEFLESM